MAGCSALLMVDVFNNKFYSLAEKQLVSVGSDTESLAGDGDTVIVGSSHGWISLFNYNTLDLFLWNPVTGRRINLPPVTCLHTPKSFVQGGCCRIVIIKLILSSSNPDDADCRVVVFYGPTNRLAFCCPSHIGANWISIGRWWYGYRDESREPRCYCDMAYSTQHNRLFCITANPHYELERWDLEDPWSPKIDGDDTLQRREEVIYQYEYKEYEKRSVYLVMAEDEVLVVVRKLYSGRSWRYNFNDPHKTTGFIIFKVVQGERSKITVHPVVELDAGLAMFVGLNHSFTLSASEYPELKPNSIYFTDPIDDPPSKSSWWCSVDHRLSQYDIGIFDYQNKIFYPCYCNEEEEDNDDRVYDEHCNEDHNAEESNEEEDNDEESNEEEDNDDDRAYDEDKDGDLPLLLWFRPTSQV